MNILFLSDLHLSSIDFCSKNGFENLIDRFSKIDMNGVDVVAIAGDVFEMNDILLKDPTIDFLHRLELLFPGKEVVFTLGNHEFAFQDFSEVIKFWKTQKNEHVHCIDVDGSFEKDGVNFVGNVLWYDYSLGEMKTNKIDSHWLDYTIRNFDPQLECAKNIQSIFKNLSKDKKNILITHTVPHKDLNEFSFTEPMSIYNNYSGVKDLLKDLHDYDISLCLCGHTHKKITKEIYGIPCYNLGNDYYWNTGKIEYLKFDI